MYDKLILKKLFGLFHLKQVGWSLPFFDCINLLQQKKRLVQKKIMGKKIDLCFLVSLTSMPRWKCTRRYDLSRSVNRPSLKAEKIKYKLIFLLCYFCIRHMHEIQDTLLFRTNLGKKKYPPSPLKCTIDGSQVMGLKLWKWCIYVGTQSYRIRKICILRAPDHTNFVFETCIHHANMHSFG